MPPARYRLLDTMRRFARDRREAHGEDRAATERLIGWALGLADWVDATIGTDNEARADGVLRRETANLRAAWSMIREQDRFDDAARLATGLHDAAGWRDLTEIWAWALELADLGRLLRALGDNETALFLDAAAGCAPDAPRMSGAGGANPDDLPPHRVAKIRAAGASAGRAHVLDAARRAITRHRATVPAGV